MTLISGFHRTKYVSFVYLGWNCNLPVLLRFTWRYAPTPIFMYPTIYVWNLNKCVHSYMSCSKNWRRSVLWKRDWHIFGNVSKMLERAKRGHNALEWKSCIRRGEMARILPDAMLSGFTPFCRTPSKLTFARIFKFEILQTTNILFGH